MVAAQERLPGPQRVAPAGSEMVGVGDHDLGAVGLGRVLEPPRRWSRRVAGMEVLLLEAGEIQSARLANRGLLTSRWRGTGNSIVIPIGCDS